MKVEHRRTPPGVTPGARARTAATVLSAVRDVLDLVPYAAVVVSERDEIALANPRSERIFGYPVAELIGLPLEVLLPGGDRRSPEPLAEGCRPPEDRAPEDRPPEGRPPSDRPLDRPLGAGRKLSAVRKDGSTFEADVLSCPLDPPHGTYRTVVVKDVALRLELLGGEEHLALSQRIALMGSWDHDLASGEVRFSRQLYRLLDLEPGSAPPRAETFFSRVDPADLPTLLAEVERARREGGPFFAQVRLSPGSAGPRPPSRPGLALDRTRREAARPGERFVAVQGSVELGDDGRPVRTVGTVQDIGAMTALERALRASDLRFQAAFDQAPNGMALIDARSGAGPALLMVNTALAELTGWSVPDLLERAVSELAHPDDRRRLADHVRQLVGGGTTEAGSVDVRLGCRDRRERWASLSGTLIRDHDGSPDYVVAHLVDITARHRAEADALERAARDRRIAAVLQKDLMPWVPRHIGPVRAACRYRPAGDGETVCGDWADVFPLPGGRIGVVVGDVAGHGIEAAATMTRLRTVVHLLATSGVSPAGVMRRLNDTLHETDLGEDLQLATLVHGQLDLATGVLLYSSAGHLPMLTLAGEGSGGAVVSPIPAIGGPPIGVIPNLRYTEQSVELEPGGSLIGYTDGLIERRGQDLDESLLALLARLDALPADVITDVEALADAVLAMSPPVRRADDIAVVVLAFDEWSGTRDGDAGRPEPPPGGSRSDRRQLMMDLQDVALPPDRWA